MGVAAAPVVMDRPVAGPRWKEGAEIAYALAPPALVELYGQRELVPLGHELLAAARVRPDALGLVPQGPAVHGGHGGGQGQPLGGDALLAGVVAQLARPFLDERLPRLVRGLPDRARSGRGRAAAGVEMVDGCLLYTSRCV